VAPFKGLQLCSQVVIAKLQAWHHYL